jgi:hypothetical protein
MMIMKKKKYVEMGINFKRKVFASTETCFLCKSGKRF